MRKIKLFLALFAIVGIVVCTHSQNLTSEGFIIKGRVSQVEDGKVYLTRYFNNEGVYGVGDTVASGTIESGHFIITGKVEEPFLGLIRYESRPDLKWDKLVVENDIFLLESEPGFSYHHPFLGGNYNYEVYRNINFDPYYLMRFYSKEYHRMEGAKYRKLETVDDTLQYIMHYSTRKKDWSEAYFYARDKAKELYAETTDPLLKAFLIEEWGMHKFEEQLLRDGEGLIKELAPYPFNQKMIELQYRTLMDKKEADNRVAVGSKYLDIITYDPEGNAVKLSDVLMKNKLVMLEFWASWCGPCKAEIPNLKSAYEKYHDKGFEIFSVSIDSKNEAWLKECDKQQLPWISTLQKTEGREIEKLYGITGVPTSFLITPEGKIIHSNKELRGDRLEPLLESLLVE